MSDELASRRVTFSKTFDMLQTLTSSPKNPFDLRAEKLQCPRQHQQQRFVFNALWELPIGGREEKGGKSEEKTGWLKQAFIILSGTDSDTGDGAMNPLTGLL